VSAGHTLLDNEVILFVKATCCVIAADGRVRSAEVKSLSHHLSKLGVSHNEADLNALVVKYGKAIHAAKPHAYAEKLSQSLASLRGTKWAAALPGALQDISRSDIATPDTENDVVRVLSRAVEAGAGKGDSKTSRQHIAESRDSVLGVNTGLDSRGFAATFSAMSPVYRALSVCLAAVFGIVVVIGLTEAFGKTKRKSQRPVDAILGHWQRDDENGDDHFYLRKDGPKVVKDVYTNDGHLRWSKHYTVQEESSWSNSVTLVAADDPKARCVLKLQHGNQGITEVAPGIMGRVVEIPWARVGNETQRPADLKPTGKKYSEMNALEREAYDAMQALKSSTRRLKSVRTQSTRGQAGVFTLGVIAALLASIWFIVPRELRLSAYLGLCIVCLTAGLLASRYEDLAYVRNNCFIGGVVAFVLSAVRRR
jgi:hypothetical protein